MKIPEKKKFTGHLSNLEQRELEACIRKYRAQSFSNIEIMEKMDIPPHIFKMYLSRVQDIDREYYNNLDNATVYAEFCEKVRAQLKSLANVEKQLDPERQGSVIVACIRQKHDLDKSLINMGQTLGFVDDKSNEVTVEQEMSFASMSTQDARKQIEVEVEKLNELASKGTVSFRKDLLNVLGKEEKKMIDILPPSSIKEDDVVKQKIEIKSKKVKVSAKVKLRKRSIWQ